MNSANKVVERKNHLRNIGDSKEVIAALESRGQSITEIDLSYNQLDNAVGLDAFPNLKVLLLDNNSFQSLMTFPKLGNLFYG